MNPTLRRFVFGEASWVRFIRSTAVIYVVVVAYMWFASNRMIFPMPPSSYADTPDVIKVPVGQGGAISALYYEGSPGGSVILHSHGNYEDIGQLSPLFEVLNAAGFGVFAYDYRGYGTSGGRATEKSAYEDAEAAFRYLRDELGVGEGRIVLHGRSVGAALAIDLAVRHPARGLLVESGFVTAFRVQTKVPVAPIDRFRNIGKMPRVRCPVLVLHGTEDEIIAPWHGRALYEAAPEPKAMVWVEGAGHNDLAWVAGPLYLEAFRRFDAMGQQKG